MKLPTKIIINNKEIHSCENDTFINFLNGGKNIQLEHTKSNLNEKERNSKEDGLEGKRRKEKTDEGGGRRL